MAFIDLTETQKGDIGEDYVFDYLTNEKNCLVYTTKRTNTSHPIDSIVFSGGTATPIGSFEVKSKTPRIKFGDFSVTKKNLDDYICLNEKITVYLCFVDETNGHVRYQQLNNLLKPCKIEFNGVSFDYPMEWKQDGKTNFYFHPKQMKMLTTMPLEIINELKSKTKLI